MNNRESTEHIVTGIIDQISYRNADNWAVFTIKGFYGYNFSGILPEICGEGEHVTCAGVFGEYKGRKQLKCSSVIPDPPDFSSEEGVRRMLKRLPGIGDHKAFLLIREHGHEKAWELAKTDPEKIGIRKANLDKAREIIASLTNDFETLCYLLGIGLTDYQAGKVMKMYGREAKNVVANNPYLMIQDIDGFGFITVDKLALKAGMRPDAPARINACIMYVMADDQVSGGHIWHEGWSLAAIVIQTITDTAIAAGAKIDRLPTKQDVKQAIYNLAAEGKLVIEDGKVFNSETLDAEKKIMSFVG